MGKEPHYWKRVCQQLSGVDTLVWEVGSLIVRVNGTGFVCISGTKSIGLLYNAIIFVTFCNKIQRR
jgi:hypothetical protein